MLVRVTCTSKHLGQNAIQFQGKYMHALHTQLLIYRHQSAYVPVFEL